MSILKAEMKNYSKAAASLAYIKIQYQAQYILLILFCGTKIDIIAANYTCFTRGWNVKAPEFFLIDYI